MITKIQNQHISYADRNNISKSPSFSGAESIGVAGLRFLNNSPAIGACVVDLCSMVIPRTVFDAKKRGKDAGIETGIRESSSTFNHAMVGVVGMGAAALTSIAINRKYRIKANHIFANNDAIDVFSSIWNSSKGQNSEERLRDFYKNSLEKLEGLNPAVKNGVETKRWIPIDSGLQKEIADTLIEKLPGETELTKPLKKNLVSRIISATGAEKTFRFKTAGEQEVADSVDVLLDTMTSIGKSFVKSEGKDFTQFVKHLKSVKLATALCGLAVSATIGCSAQPINKYLTKKRTGKSGFVGVEGREPDKSKGFKIMKFVDAAIMGCMAFTSIDKNPSKVLNKIQFTHKLPNLNQFKLLYGMTIMSRILSARDKNELRESTIKDYLGFANWLILGGMVSKLVARALPGGKELVNAPEIANGAKKGIKHAWQWITKTEVKTYDEVLLPEAGKEIKTALKNGEKIGFVNLLNAADKATKTKVGKLAFAQVAGYLYSGLILGLGIAKLNAYITGKAEKKAKTQVVSNDQSVKFYAQNNKVDNNSVFSKINT